jgi:hypothetical protein
MAYHPLLAQTTGEAQRRQLERLIADEEAKDQLPPRERD